MADYFESLICRNSWINIFIPNVNAQIPYFLFMYFAYHFSISDPIQRGTWRTVTFCEETKH